MMVKAGGRGLPRLRDLRMQRRAPERVVSHMPSQLALPYQTTHADARAIDPKRFRWLLWALCRVSAELERMFPWRSFMRERRVADAVAQGIAEAFCEVDSLLDGHADDLPALIVRAAQGGKVWLDDCPEHLLVLRLFRNGSFEEV